MITVEEILQAAEAQPELKTALLSSLKDDAKAFLSSEYIIRSAEEDESYVTSKLEAVLPQKLEERFNEKFRTGLDEIDNTLKELTGYAKNPGEKTTEFAKRAIAEFKAKGGDELSKERIKQLEEVLQQKDDDFSRTKSELSKKLFDREVDYQLNSAFEKLAFFVPAHLKSDEEKQAYIEQQRSLIASDFSRKVAPKDHNGNIVFYDGEQPLLNVQDGKAKSALDIIQERYATQFVKPKATVTGTGATADSLKTSTALSSTDDIHKHLQAQGIQAGSAEYSKQFEKLCADNKISV